MALATLSIDLVAQLAKLEQGLDKAGRLAEKQAHQIERAFSGLKVAAAGLGGVIAGAFSVTTIQQFFAATVDGLDRLNDLKDATGSSIENISALEDVALRTGTSFEAMSTSLVKLNSFLKDAGPGTKQAEVLKAIGLSAKELKALDPAEALLRIATALQGYADDGNKARIVQELFGKSIQEVAPLLKDLAEKGKLVATVTTEQAQAAEDFNKQLAVMSKNITDLSRGPIAELLTNLNRAIERWKELGTLGALRFNMERSPGWAGLFGGGGQNDLTEYQKAVDKLAAARKALAEFKPGTGLYGTSNKAFGERLKRDVEELEKLVKVRGALLGLDPSAGAGRGGGAPSLPSAPDVSGIGGRVGGGGSGKAAKERQPSGLDDATLAALENDRLQAEQLKELEKATEHTEKLLEEQINAYAEWRTKLNEIELDRLEKQEENAKKNAEKMSVFAEQAARNIQDALGDTVFDLLSGKFDDIGKRWSNLLKRMAAEALAAQLGKAIFGDMGKTGWGLVGEVAKTIFGGLPSFDVGTPYVPRDMVAKVHRGEAIIPAAQNRPGAMGAGYVDNRTINNYIDSNTNQAQIGAIVSNALREYDRGLMERLRAQPA